MTTSYIAACFPMTADGISGDIIAAASGATEAEAAAKVTAEIEGRDFSEMRIKGHPVDHLEISIEPEHG